MAASCPHCRQEFHATRGIFGQDAISLRDAHVLTCEDNPRNRCFCGKVFPNFAARDSHATVCAMNPANRYKCPHCPQEFLTTFGMMGFKSADGRSLRDYHAVGCQGNPANKCFCGQLFANPDARNSHASKCVMNPVNRFECQFCNSTFVTTYNVLGFRSCDGRASRDAHQVCCETNPRNRCFCGRQFPNPTARDKHAKTCEANPSNRFSCRHCKELFVTKYRIMGLVASNGKTLRDSHEVGCRKNSANTCFCGQLFPNPDARDAHAVVCEMNPANRFSCQFCGETFVTSFGVFTACGEAQRNSHMVRCSKNPANATCEHCGTTFTDASGPLRWLHREALRQCEAHVPNCVMNPANRFGCERCGRCFVTQRRWLRLRDGRAERDAHAERCDLIPCDYEVSKTEQDGWLLLGPDMQESMPGASTATGDASWAPEASEDGGEADLDSFCDVDSIGGGEDEEVALERRREEEEEEEEEAGEEAEAETEQGEVVPAAAEEACDSAAEGMDDEEVAAMEVATPLLRSASDAHAAANAKSIPALAQSTSSSRETLAQSTSGSATPADPADQLGSECSDEADPLEGWEL